MHRDSLQMAMQDFALNQSAYWTEVLRVVADGMAQDLAERMGRSRLTTREEREARHRFVEAERVVRRCAVEVGRLL